MRKILTIIIILSFLAILHGMGAGGDTLYVRGNDSRYLKYLDSLYAYQTSLSVAKNVSDSIRKLIGNDTYTAFFMDGFSGKEPSEADYVFELKRNVIIDLGKISIEYSGFKNADNFPWRYLYLQYRRLDSIKIQPYAVMQGGELPTVYIWKSPTIFVKSLYYCPHLNEPVSKPYSCIYPQTRFIVKDDGKTRIPYVEQWFYHGKNFGETVDSILKLDPVTLSKLDY